MKEDELQRQIVKAYRHAGRTVLITSRRRKRCHYCGHYSRGGDGVTKGTPDLFVSARFDSPGLWHGVEVKGDDTAVSPEQQELADAGAITIARTLEEALAAAGVGGWEVR